MSPAGQLPEKEAGQLAKRSWGKHASRIATGLVVILFVVYAVNDQEALSDLLMVSWATLLLVAIGRLLIFFSNGMFIKWTAEAFTRRLSMGEGIYVGILSAVGNFLGPLLGGAGIRAVYLRRVHDLPYTYFTSTLMVYYVFLFAINLALAIGGLWTLDLGLSGSRLIALFGSGLLLLVLSVFIRLPERIRAHKVQRSKLISRLVGYLIDIEDGWRRLLGKPSLLIRLVGLATLSVAAQFLIASAAFDSIGAEISWAALAIYVSIVTISLLVAVTPGAIGVREAMLLLISETLGVTDNEILQVAVIDRGVTFAILFALFIVTRNTRLRTRLTSGGLYA